MKDLLENAPKIIAEAAKSPLGIVALLILAGSTLAWLFFGESSELIKAGVFVFVFIGFLFLAKASFDHSSENTTENNSVEEIVVSVPEVEVQSPPAETVEVSETFEWVDPNDKYNTYELSRVERDVLQALKGKPDVRWTDELVKGAVVTRSAADDEDLDNGINSLVRKGYLRRNADSVYVVLPLAVEYYRATDATPVHEIDEADYWDGT